MFKLIGRLFIFVLLLPVLYILIALLTSLIPINKAHPPKVHQDIYLTTNGVHLYIILDRESVDSSLLSDLDYTSKSNYFSFGWGDKNFYLNTPKWSDLTFKNTINALFLNTSSLMHVDQYTDKNAKWIEIPVSKNQLEKLNSYILKSFKINDSGKKIKLPFNGYTDRDSFYEANGNYNCFNTSNSWVNTGFKKSGLKACYWTPFDFFLIEKHKNHN